MWESSFVNTYGSHLKNLFFFFFLENSFKLNQKTASEMGFRGLRDKRSHLFWGQLGLLDWFPPSWAQGGVKRCEEQDRIWLLWMKGSIPGVSVCAHYKPIFSRVSHKSKCTLALKNETETRLGIWGCGWPHSATEVSHLTTGMCLGFSLYPKNWF